jgi:hypothetical protein
MEKQNRQDVKEAVELMKSDNKEKVLLCSGCFSRASNLRKCAKVNGLII